MHYLTSNVTIPIPMFDKSNLDNQNAKIKNALPQSAILVLYFPKPNSCPKENS